VVGSAARLERCLATSGVEVAAGRHWRAVLQAERPRVWWTRVWRGGGHD